MTTQSSGEIDSDSFDIALGNFHRMNEARLRAMYNRQRAVFAEFLVAALLPAAVVEIDPSQPWDVTWSIGGDNIRIQVKCSGRFLPHHPANTTPASWDIQVPRTA